MKANRRFRDIDDAVSPVIAVILMVAITVVLAATVYTWVGGFRGAAAQPASAVALTSFGNIANPGAGNYYKNYTIVNAMQGMKYGDFTLTLNGQALTADLGAACEPSGVGRWSACGSGSVRGALSQVAAGDVISIRASSDPSGMTLRFIDPASNSVMHTVAIQ